MVNVAETGNKFHFDYLFTVKVLCTRLIVYYFNFICFFLFFFGRRRVPQMKMC